MAFKKVEAGNGGETKKLSDLGSITGRYLAKREINRKDGGTSTIFKIRTREGEIEIWGFGQLNALMNGVAENSVVRITYNGTQKMKTKYGVRDVHSATVEVDDGAPASQTPKQAIAAQKKPASPQEIVDDVFNADDSNKVPF